MKFNIRLKLVLFTFCIVLLVGGSISLHSLFLGQRRIMAAFEDEARRSAALIAAALANDIYFLDIRSLRRRLESSRLKPDITYTLLMDLEGAVLSDGTSANVLRDQKPSDPFSVGLLQADGWISKVEPGLLKVGGPVFMPDGSRVGYLNLGFSLQTINETVRESTRSHVYLTAFAFGIALILTFGLAASFSRPLLTVAYAAKEIGEGRFDTRLSLSSRDELGMLGQSLNLMAETLQKRHADVRKTVKLLEQEIAERKEAEESVRQSEERFRSLVAVITDIPWVTGATGAFVTPQPAWEAYTGQTWEQYRGFGWADAFHPDDRERIKENWKEACARRMLYQSEARLWHAAPQQWRSFMAKAAPLFNTDGSVREWIGSCTDVEEQKRSKERLESTVTERTRELQEANAALLRDMEERNKLEEQLLQAQKMEGIGTLAGGIAHDFNNILNIIQGYASILHDYGAQNEQIRESLTVINETVKRGSALVQQLLTLARKSNTQWESVNVNVLIEKLITLLTETFPKTIEMSSALEADLPPIMADKNQIEQALLNICVNARDAMSDSGRLTFTTQSVDSAGLQGLGEAIESRYVCIEVNDTGMGMDESVQKRIFEPFFTTKDIGKGTGLGLSVVYGIVKSHSGLIDFESKPDCGTSFRLYFPVVPSLRKLAIDGIAENTFETRESVAGCGTVLLVEDEKDMLDLLERVLLQHGYHVFTATDREKALEIYWDHKQTIDAVLLDIGLPKIAGRDLVLKIKDENPNVKIVIASGYLEPEVKSEIDEAGVNYFLHKPFMLDELVKTVQSVMSSRTLT